MTQPVDCKYFYGDYFRGRNHEECRLLDTSPENTRPWKRKLCDTCPVPEILLNSNSESLALEAKIMKRFFREYVKVTFAVCTKHMLELEDPLYCPACASEAEGRHHE